MAPMEGLTGYIYRNAYQKYFHDIDRYFTPFITNKKLDFTIVGKNNDLIKKHKMRNIVVFADVNNIKLMVENIESDKDYEFLSKLDLYTVDK